MLVLFFFLLRSLFISADVNSLGGISLLILLSGIFLLFSIIEASSSILTILMKSAGEPFTVPVSKLKLGTTFLKAFRSPVLIYSSAALMYLTE